MTNEKGRGLMKNDGEAFEKYKLERREAVKTVMFMVNLYPIYIKSWGHERGRRRWTS